MDIISNNPFNTKFADVDGGNCFKNKDGDFFIKMRGYYQEPIGRCFKVNALNLKSGYVNTSSAM